MENELVTQLAELRTEQKSFHDKAAEEQKEHGTMLATTKTALDALQKQVDAIDIKLAASHAAAPEQRKSILDTLTESEDVSRMLRNKKGQAVVTLSGDQVMDMMSQKTTVLLSGQSAAAAGVVSIERMPGIVPEARRKLTIRDLLSARPTTAGLIYFIKVNAPMVNASPQVEGSAKFENAVTFTTASAAVKTIATWIPASRQALDDVAELDGFLRASLPFYVNKEEERQLLSGDNTGENLNGLITQASAFNSSLLSASAGYTRIDQIGAAIEQVAIIDEVPPSFVVLNPRDWWNLRRTKDTQGRYILGDPQSMGNPTIWDLTVLSTNSVASGTFLVGGGDPAQAEIRDRMEMTVEVSTEHGTYFTQNLVAIRAEKRLALVVQRPQSFITGTFATSPA
jgi:HK97 family phage major capsid protein